MENVYYLTAVIVYGIFIVQFILSWVGGHADIDFDGHTDFDVGDLVSFKGLIHLLMGFSGWTASQQYFTGTVSNWDWTIGAAIGIILMLILYFIYKFCMKLQYIPKREPKEALVGKTGTVYLRFTEHHFIVFIQCNGQQEEIEVKSKEPMPNLRTGDYVQVTSYENGEYFIH